MNRHFIFFLLFCSFVNGYAQNMENEPPKLRINLSGGMGYSLASSAQSEKDMINYGFDEQKVKDFANNLRWSFQGNADIQYLCNEHLGIGAKYMLFRNHGNITQEKNIPTSLGYGNILFMRAKETDYVNYVGPSIHLRTSFPLSHWAVSATLSGGYAYLWSRMSFEDNTNIFPAIGTADCFGAVLESGVEYFLTTHIALSADINYFINSPVNTLHVRTPNKPSIDIKITNKEGDISRVGLYLGVKFYL